MIDWYNKSIWKLWACRSSLYKTLFHDLSGLLSQYSSASFLKRKKTELLWNVAAPHLYHYFGMQFLDDWSTKTCITYDVCTRYYWLYPFFGKNSQWLANQCKNVSFLFRLVYSTYACIIISWIIFRLYIFPVHVIYPVLRYSYSNIFATDTFVRNGS